MIGKDSIVLCFKYIKLPSKKRRGVKLPFDVGCACSRGVKGEKKVKKKGSDKPSKKLETAVSGNEGSDIDGDVVLTKNPEKSVSSTPAKRVEGDKKSRENGGIGQLQAEQPKMCRVMSIQNGLDGAHVVAGWPSWLASVAGEAINGWIPRKADAFHKLDKIGQGTYSSVYRALDLDTGKIVAMKKVRFISMDPESVRFMAREILVLRRLDHPNVMKLEGLVVSRASGHLYLVFEYMEHDLSGLLTSPLVKFTEPQIKCLMQQLLHGLKHCHDRGVLHRDIKGSNLLIDDDGNLKIGDFGLANFYNADQKQPLTSRVVTLWYRPPELLLGATEYGVAVDMWSSGCILAELFVGKPIMPGRTEVEQLHKIYKLCGSPSEDYWKKSNLTPATVFKPQQPYKRCMAETFKDLPPKALSLLDTLLAFEPESRGTARSALQSEFFTTKPLPCDPWALPKCPPSKEMDIKLREEARRESLASGNGIGGEQSRKVSKESRAILASDANGERRAQKQTEQSDTRAMSKVHNPDENAESFQRSKRCHSRLRCASGNSLHMDEGLQLTAHRALDSAYGAINSQRSFKPQTSAAFSRFSSSVRAAHGNSQLDLCRDTSVHSRWLVRYPNASRYEEMNGLDISNNGQVPRRDNETGYVPQNNRMHYSGPLLPPGGGVEEMLKEHEKQIQNAVRKALVAKSRKYNMDY